MNKDDKKILLNILTDTSAIPNTLLDYYRDLGLSEEETLFLIVLLRLQQNKYALTIKNTAKNSAYREEEVMRLVPVLIDKGFLALANDGAILLDGLVEKFLEVQSWQALKTEQKIRKERKNSRTDSSFAELYQCFEGEMGRPLSPIEGERIRYWYKNLKIPAELIRAGLTRAVLLGKNNFRYIEAILLSWQRKNIHSVRELELMENNEENSRKKRPSSEHDSRTFRKEQDDDELFSDDIYEVF